MSGLIAFTGPPDPDLLQRMLEQLSHRGQPVGPPLQTASGTVATLEWPSFLPIGKVRTGCYSSGYETIAFSGFAYQPLPSRLSIPQLNEIRGSHAIAWIADERLIIARDCLGNQSLFYGRIGDRWLAASEPKAITSQPGFAAKIRPAAVAQYLAFSFVPDQGSMLENLWEVPSGHAITFSANATPVTTRYFFFEQHEAADARDNDWETPSGDRPTRDDDDYWIAKTRETIRQAVANRWAAGMEPMVFLSGGLDSSIVAAEMATQCAKPIRTFSLHFGSKYPNELEYARQVARRIGSRHEEVLIQPKQFVRRLQEMVWHLDEPIGDPITQPNFELARHVSQYGPAVFNGEGGDPLFGGPKNLPMMLAHWYGVPRSPNFREQAYLASYRRAYDECETLFTPEFLRQIDPVQDLEGLLAPYFKSTNPRMFLNKLMAINIRLKGAHLILPKVDRMLAASQLTPLSPLFDERLTELSFAMPPRMKLRNGIEKWVLKRAYQDLLPKEIIERPKSGMRVPVHHWFQRELKTFARRLLSRRELDAAGIFDHRRVQELLLYNPENGASRFGIRLWMLLTFEIWRRTVVKTPLQVLGTRSTTL